MLQDVDETLRRLLTAELETTPGCPIYDADQITFDPPAVAEAALDREAHVNLYLHDVRENLALRDESFRVMTRPDAPDASRAQIGEKGRRRSPVRLDLSYLVTVYAGEEPAVEHRLLSDVLGVLLRRLAVPNEFLEGALEGLGSNAITLSVAQTDNETYKDPPGLWQALGGRLRPALGLLVTAPFDPFETKWTRLVREAALGFGPTAMSDQAGERPGLERSTHVSVAGIVMDQATERPLAGARVTVPGQDEADAATDEGGFFFLLNRKPGALTLRVAAKGYQAREVSAVAIAPGRPDQLQSVVVALRPQSDAEFAAEQARLSESERGGGGAQHVSLSGRLRFPDGRPGAYLPVRVGSRRTSTNADGVYVFADLPLRDGTNPSVFADVPGVGEVALIADAQGTATVPLPGDKKA